jgi:hypothetical protein
MSNSASSSSAYTTNYNTQTTGGAGAGAVTISSQGNAIVTDAGQTANAINAVSNIALAALDSSMGLLSDFNAREAQGEVTQNEANNNLLSTLLGNNQTLAQNVQSGGATTGMELTTKVVIGALALMGLLIAFVLFRK